MQCPILPELFERVILVLDVKKKYHDSIMQQCFFLSYLFNSRHTSISIVFVLRMASKAHRRFQETLDNVDENIAQICHKHSIIMRTL